MSRIGRGSMLAAGVIAVLAGAGTMAYVLSGHGGGPAMPVTVTDPAAALASVERDIRRRFPDLVHAEPDGVARMLGKPDVVVVDVREPAEFAVSRLPGAIRVDPGIGSDAFVRGFQAIAPGKTFVLYCSVGERSSRLAARVATDIKAAGARDVVNLSGGIFRWHNERRPLARAQDASGAVHPYDYNWGRLVDRPKAAPGDN
ncbi:MAG: rhodanese-like domain-containing protein [Hyphomicrobiaceae bacterium]|nr:rhodanese-like domain-containing protein [Hyphomicrobiaceae bacterium]